MKSAENQGRERQKRRDSRPLERRLGPPISLSCRPLPVFRRPEPQGCTKTKARPDGGRVNSTVAQWRTNLCVLTISPRFIVPPSASTGSSRCSTRQTADGSPGYPPYNIERTGENTYRISVAVSGFSQGELSIVAKENTLTIKGEKTANENGKDKSEVLYRGIAARAFERAFQLADFVHGEERLARERPAPRRSRPRDSRGQEAPQHSDHSTGASAAQVVDGSADKAAA